MNNVTRITGPVIPTKRSVVIFGLTHQGRHELAKAFGTEYGLKVYTIDKGVYPDHGVAEKVLAEKAMGKEPCVVGYCRGAINAPEDAFLVFLCSKLSDRAEKMALQQQISIEAAMAALHKTDNAFRNSNTVRPGTILGAREPGLAYYAGRKSVDDFLAVAGPAYEVWCAKMDEAARMTNKAVSRMAIAA